MSVERVNDLLAFRSYLDQRLAAEGSPPTPHELLAEWEVENQTDAEFAASLEAVERGLADVAAGRVRPAREALSALREEFGLPPLR